MEGLKMIKKIVIDGHEFPSSQDTDFTKLPKEFGGAFPSPSPMLVSELPGHMNRINAAPYVFVQPKLDGHCCMANTRTRKIYTRSGHEITTLPHINTALPQKITFVFRIYLVEFLNAIFNGNIFG